MLYIAVIFSPADEKLYSVACAGQSPEDAELDARSRARQHGIRFPEIKTIEERAKDFTGAAIQEKTQ